MYKEINIPEVLNPASISSLNAQLLECENQNVRFVVLKGSSSIFCNGLDLSWVANSEEADHHHDMKHYADFLKKLQCGKFISIALVKGVVSGGGMGVVCACDHVVADESSTFSLPEGLLGLIPGMILPSLLNRLSPQLVKKMVFTGKKYSVSIAKEFGVVDEITNDQEKALTDAINSMRSCKPDAVNDIKEIVYTSNANKDELAVRGMNILNKRLQEPDIKQRLKDISDFM
ncbi:enoyl-CoA hydratase/isomerase family protein [Aurantibacillus circumpalustris]|uniref:enoyl-CoA hydratase/isomerase family protein n=1 Tax=Aurantibacillus circumpalustris TaxID=3036359 RepID=UPI00295AAFFB|nr:enoyl-CoA hydratase/isomerase family protein [Aurantibacillus circumpalustris]